jgi:hypothetical protein
MSSVEIREWTPPIETGLSSNDVYLAEQILDHAADTTAAKRPGVYALELSKPDHAGHEMLSRLWLSEHDAIPEYLERIADADRVLYVGAATGENGVLGRFRTHLNNPNRSSVVAEVFPIHHIEQIWWYNTPTEADDREHGHALDLAREHPEAYVHCR